MKDTISPLIVALFDLDDTLINGDSDWHWADFLVEKNILTKNYRDQNDIFFEQYHAGTLNPNDYLRHIISLLKNKPYSYWLALRDIYIKERIEPMIVPRIIHFIQWHRQQGMEVVLVTATNQFIAEPIAKLLTIDTLIASQIEIKDGYFTGEPQGVPNFKEGKIANLTKWLKTKGHTLATCKSRFYSDSINDVPLLEAVQKPIATNPCPQLRSIAQERGWAILEFFS